MIATTVRTGQRTLAVGLLCLLGCAEEAAEVADAAAADDTAESNTDWTFGGETAVTTSLGDLIGAQADLDTLVWRGVPFAQPPVGLLRWRAPQPPQAWAGERDVRMLAPLCPQQRADGLPTSEDCLYLNVWRPHTAELDLPVFMWIHGGGNRNAAPSTHEVDGAQLAADGNVIVVTINYRVNYLGFLTHPALRADAGDDLDSASGNFGLLDQIQAMKWIRDHIADFGGDPDRVTIGGQSAGARNTLAHIISPLSAGLFHRALVMSGRRTVDPVAGFDATAEAMFGELLALVGEDSGSLSDAQLVEVARAQSAGAIATLGAAGTFNLIADGHVLPEQGFEVLESGDYNQVPMIIGMTREEPKYRFSDIPDLLRQQQVYQDASVLMSDLQKVDGRDAVLRSLAAQQGQQGQPAAYGYDFAWGSSLEDGTAPVSDYFAFRLGAFHTLDVPFFFGTDRVHVQAAEFMWQEANVEGREALSSVMRGYLANLIHTGDPNEGPLADRIVEPWTAWVAEEGGEKIMELHGDMRASRERMIAQEHTIDGVSRDVETFDMETCATVVAMTTIDNDILCQ